MPAAYCHECSTEFESDTIASCPMCRGTFIEEIGSIQQERLDQQQQRVERREEAQRMGARAGVPPFPISAFLASFGLIPPIGGGGDARAVDVRQRTGNDEDPGDPDDDVVLPGRFAQGNAVRGAAGIPITNLAAYLGDAFAEEELDHDHEGNNPFAEDAGQEVIRRPRALSVGSRERERDGYRRAANATANANPHPLEYLISLIGSLGSGRAGAGANSIGDFAIGDTGFDRILTELMDQASSTNGPKPASPEIIESLPRTKLTTEMMNNSTSDCAICRDDYEVGDDLIEMPCNHLFHPKCLILWLNTNGSCPVCRFSLVPNPDDPNSPQIPSSTTTHTVSSSAAEEIISGLRTSRRAGPSRIPGSYPEAEDAIMSEDLD